MAKFSIFPQLPVFNAKRLLNRQNLEKSLPFLRILFILLTLVFVALAAISVTDTQDKFSLKLEKFLKDNEIKAVPTPNTHKPKLPDNLSVPLAKIFGPVGATPAPANQGKPAESMLPLSLIGVFLPGSEDAYAIIQDDKKTTQDVFAVGESIFGAAKLVKIYPDKVEINRDGAKEILTMDAADGKSTSTPTGAISENEFVVEEAELDKALENLPLLLTQARAVPYFKDGKAVGLRLFAIRTGSLFEKIGLQNGDVLKSVNGNSLADLSQAMQLFQKLKEERSIDLVMERNLVEKSFKYQIK